MSHRDETHVVIVMRVSRHTIRQSGIGRACPLCSAEHSTVTLAFCNDHPANDVRCSLPNPGENDPNRVTQRGCRSLTRLHRRFGSHDEFGNLKGYFHVASLCRQIIAPPISESRAFVESRITSCNFAWMT